MNTVTNNFLFEIQIHPHRRLNDPLEYYRKHKPVGMTFTTTFVENYRPYINTQYSHILTSHITVQDLLQTVDKFNHIYDTLFFNLVNNINNTFTTGLITSSDISETNSWDYIVQNSLFNINNVNDIETYYSVDGFFGKLSQSLPLTTWFTNNNTHDYVLTLFVLGFDMEGNEIPKIIHVPFSSDFLEPIKFNIQNLLQYVPNYIPEPMRNVNLTTTFNVLSQLQQLISNPNSSEFKMKLYNVLSYPTTFNYLVYTYIDKIITSQNKQMLLRYLMNYLDKQIVQHIFDEFSIPYTNDNSRYTVLDQNDYYISQYVFNYINNRTTQQFYYIGLKTNYDIHQLKSKLGIIYILPMILTVRKHYDTQQQLIVKNEYGLIVDTQIIDVGVDIISILKLYNTFHPKF